MDSINPSKPLGSIPPVGGRSSPSHREHRDSRDADRKKRDASRKNFHESESENENTMIEPAKETDEQEKPEGKGTRIDIQV